MTNVGMNTSDLVGFLTGSLSASDTTSEPVTDVKNSMTGDLLGFLGHSDNPESTGSFYSLLVSSANASPLKTNRPPLKTVAAAIQASAESNRSAGLEDCLGVHNISICSEDLATLLQNNYRKFD
jgi:hypothetical protein